MAAPAYLEEKSTLGDTCFGNNLENPTIGNYVFLSNDTNIQKYYKEYELFINEYHEKISEGVEEIKNKCDDNEAIGIAIIQSEGDISSYSFRGNIILPMEDKKFNNQFLERIPVLKKLADKKQRIEGFWREFVDELKKDVETNMPANQLRQKIEDFQGELKKKIETFQD